MKGTFTSLVLSRRFTSENSSAIKVRIESLEFSSFNVELCCLYVKAGNHLCLTDTSVFYIPTIPWNCKHVTGSSIYVTILLQIRVKKVWQVDEAFVSRSNWNKISMKDSTCLKWSACCKVLNYVQKLLNFGDVIKQAAGDINTSFSKDLGFVTA